MEELFAALILSSVISIISYKIKYLTKSGSAAMFVLAFLIFGFGGWKFTLPIVSFFISSSYLTKLNGNKNKPIDTFNSNQGQRNYKQVLANGSLAALVVLLNKFYDNELLYVVYVSIIASACADTWATEIGTYNKAKTINIVTFKTAEPGISGGISFPGTMAAFAAVFFIFVSSVFFINNNLIKSFVIIFASSILGSFADSVMGAVIQSKYLCRNCGRTVETRSHCNKPAEYVSGIKLIDNNWVNFLSSFTAAAVSFLLIFI